MDEHGRWELEQKEWCPIRIEIGSCTIEMEVISLHRLEQEARGRWKDGEPAVCASAIVLERVTCQTVVAAIDRLRKGGFFDRA